MQWRRIAQFETLVLTASLWFLGKFLRYAFPPLFDALGRTYGVSKAVLGTAFTGFMLVYAAMQFPSGVLADRLGSVRVITGGAVLAAAGALVLVVDSPFLVLAGAMLVMGAGTGAHKTVSVRLLSRAYPARTGRVLGVFDTFGTFGGVVAPAAVVFALDRAGVFGAGWRTLFLVAGVVGLGVAVAFHIRVPQRLAAGGDATDEQPQPSGDATSADASADSTRTLSTYLALFRDWHVSVFVAVTLLFSFAYNGIVAFLPLYLTDAAGLSTATASLIFSALFVVSLVQPVTGEASDRFGTRPVIAVTLGLATVGQAAIVALTGTGGPLALGGAVVCLGLGAHGYRPVRGAYLMAVLPEDVAGGSLGVVRTLLMGAGAISPAVVGVLSETVGFGPAFSLMLATLAGGTALAVALWLLDREP